MLLRGAANSVRELERVEHVDQPTSSIFVFVEEGVTFGEVNEEDEVNIVSKRHCFDRHCEFILNNEEFNSKAKRLG